MIQSVELDYDTAAAAVHGAEINSRMFVSTINIQPRLHIRGGQIPARGDKKPPQVIGRFRYTISSMIALHNANTAVVVHGQSCACKTNVAWCCQLAYIWLFATPASIFYRFPCLPIISSSLLGWFGYTVASTIALHHANTAVVVPGRSGARAVNMECMSLLATRCREKKFTTPVS